MVVVGVAVNTRRSFRTYASNVESKCEICRPFRADVCLKLIPLEKAFFIVLCVCLCVCVCAGWVWCELKTGSGEEEKMLSVCVC